MGELEAAAMRASDAIAHHFAAGFFACRRRRRRRRREEELAKNLASGGGELLWSNWKGVSPQVDLAWA